MLPTNSSSNSRNIVDRYIKSIGNLISIVFLRVVHFSYLNNVVILEDRPSVSFTSSNKPKLAGSLFILLLGNIFKVFNTIIGFISIFVVNIKSFWSFAYKCVSNKCMDIIAFPYSIIIEIKSMVSKLPLTSFYLSMKNKVLSPEWISTSTNIPKIGNLINSFIANNITPFFHNHSLNKKTPFGGLKETDMFPHLLGVLFGQIKNSISFKQIKYSISYGICLFLFVSPSFAQQQNEQDQFYVIEDFSKLLQSHTTPFANPDGVANDVLNVRANDQAGALAKREPQLTYGTCYASAVKGLSRYYKSNGSKYTIENVDTSIYNGSDTGASCVWLGQGNTAGKRWDWLTYKDIAIGSDGYDAPVKWDGKTQVTLADGSRTNGDLVAQLGAPFAELNTGTNLDASSWYQYKVACLNSSGQYYYSNARSNPILTLDTTIYNTTLTDVPLCQSGTTHRYIYRTVGKASRADVLAETSFYLNKDIADNTTTTYDDNMTDATLLGDAAPTWATVSAGINITPPYGKHLLLVKERLLMGNRPDGTAQGKSTIYTSEVYNPDLFDTNNSDKIFLVNPDDGDEITSIENFMGATYIAKNNSWQKLYSDDTSVANWKISTPFSQIGVSAPYSVSVMPLGIIYLNRDGLYKLNGQASELISDAVTKDIRNISPTNVPETAGIYWNNEYDLAYADSSTGSATNNRVLIYDFARKSFTKDSKNVDSWAKFDSGTDFGTLYAGSSLADGIVTAQQASPNILVKRYLSDLTDGTTYNTGSTGTQEVPYLELAWDKTINDVSFGTTTINGYLPITAIIDRPLVTGTWTSPIYDLSASEFDKLYWNAQLNTGTITWAIRSATTSSGVSGASWSSEFSNPSGSDLSALTANRYVQLRATLTTPDITITPYLETVDDFMFKLTYSAIGTVSETSVLAMWKSGFIELESGRANYPKIIKEANVYYTGTTGTLNFQIENLKGDIIANFTVDLSQARNPSAGYFGNENEKVFRYNLPITPGVANYLVGDKFRITITENSTATWKIQRFSLRYSTQPYVTYR